MQTGVRFLQPQAKLLYLTRIVDALMEARNSTVLPQVQEKCASSSLVYVCVCVCVSNIRLR